MFTYNHRHPSLFVYVLAILFFLPINGNTDEVLDPSMSSTPPLNMESSSVNQPLNDRIVELEGQIRLLQQKKKAG